MTCACSASTTTASASAQSSPGTQGCSVADQHSSDGWRVATERKMTDNSGAGQGAGKKRRKQSEQRANAAAELFARLSDRTEAARAELARLKLNLSDVLRGSTRERGTELREA